MPTQPGADSGLPPEFRVILASSFFIRFSTTGRRTGARRTTETTYVWDGGKRIYVSGYPGRRDWIANAAASPDITLHTVEGGQFYDIPARARVVQDRRERTPHLLAFIEHWASAPGGSRCFFPLIVASVRLNTRLRLPWWGPFYLVRRVLDRMPCLELTFVGPPVARRGPPPAPTDRGRG